MVDGKIEKINIKELVPADYNPRKISEKDYKNLKRSIDEFGVVDPIIINLKDNTIIGGHQRFDVLFYENQISDLNLITLGDIGWVFPDTNLKIHDKNHEKALNLALNRVHGEWDEDLLNNVLIELEELNLDHLTGFDMDLDDINYDFITRMEDEEELIEEDISEEEYEYEDYDEIEDTSTEEIIEDIVEEKEETSHEKKEDKRIRRGFIKYGDIYRIGESSYLMFGKDTNEQDRTKLLNCNIQKRVFTPSEELKKIKTINQEINYYMSDDAELVENIIIENNNISKKIT